MTGVSSKVVSLQDGDRGRAETGKEETQDLPLAKQRISGYRANVLP